MKVILLQDVKKIGKLNDIIEVKEGYAKNFLFARKLAKPADQISIQQINIKKAKQSQNKVIETEIAQKNKDILEATTLIIKTKAGDNGKLFKAVSENDIKTQIKVPYKYINFMSPIKNLGEYEVVIKLTEEIEAKVKIKVK